MAYQKGLTATLAELEAFYKSENAGDILELCNQTNDILSDVQFMESNQSDGHVTRIRTGLPPVYWRRLYKGTPPGKSQWTQVKEGCSMLEARSELDTKELELYGDKARAFRLSEDKAFMESMRQKVASTLFYGDHDNRPDEFNGLVKRYRRRMRQRDRRGGAEKGKWHLHVADMLGGQHHSRHLSERFRCRAPEQRPWRIHDPRTRTGTGSSAWAVCIPGIWDWPCATGVPWCVSATFRQHPSACARAKRALSTFRP